MKKPNLRIMELEGEEPQLKGLENIYKKIVEENFPNIKREMTIKAQEAYRTPNGLGLKRKFPCHIIIKTKTYRRKY